MDELQLRREVVAEGRALLGVQWAHQGRSNSGIDCVGLPVTVAKKLGLSSFDLTNYGRMPQGQELMRVLRSVMPELPRNKYDLGDLIVFASGGEPTHVGIVADYLYGGFSIIHADNRARPEPRVIEHRLSGTPLIHRVVAAFSIIGAYR